MKKCLNTVIKWLYDHVTLQGLILIFQIFVAIGCLVCVSKGRAATTPEMIDHYSNAANVHVMLSWICTFAILIAGATRFGSTPFFPKFIAYDAED